MYIHVIFNPNEVKKPQGNKAVQYFKILNSVINQHLKKKVKTELCYALNVEDLYVLCFGVSLLFSFIKSLITRVPKKKKRQR